MSHTLMFLLSVLALLKSGQTYNQQYSQDPSGPCLKGIHCIIGYELVPGVGCYKLVKNSLTWEQARSYCETQNSHLAIPDTLEELYELKNRFSVPHGIRPWIGVHKSGGSWTTVKGTSEVFGWAAAEPKGAGDCAGLGGEGLFDYNCWSKGSSICEQNLV